MDGMIRYGDVDMECEYFLCFYVVSGQKEGGKEERKK